MQKDRIITVVFQIKEPEASKAIWDAFGSNNKEDNRVAGCQILAISNGSALEQRDEADSLLEDVAEYLSLNHLGDEEAEDLLDRITRDHFNTLEP